MGSTEKVNKSQWLSEAFLNHQIESILDFYTRYGIQKGAGFNQSLHEDGSVKDPDHYHLVSSCRWVVNFCRGAMLSSDAKHRAKKLAIVEHGLAFIEQHHYSKETNGFHWELNKGQVSDADQYCYGYAFLLLTYANAYQAGIQKALEKLELVHDLMHEKFWQPQHGLFADQVDAQSNELSSYRGQNANMHSCEALIAAYEATNNELYLNQALQIADHIVNRQTKHSAGLLWEHFDDNWQIDWAYNQDDPQNLYKPWGYQTGHFTEWAKLLLILHSHKASPWMLEKAKFLVDTAWRCGWDDARGGLYYGFDPQGDICDDHKYFWVQAETLPALAMLNEQFPGQGYDAWLQQLAAYTQSHFIHPTTKVWKRILNANNQPLDAWVALPGAKCDYHSIGACFDLLRCKTY